MLSNSTGCNGCHSFHLSWPVDQFCVVQNKNSLALVSQLVIALNVVLNSSNIKPSSFNHSPYPNKKSTISCTVLNIVPYGTVIGLARSHSFLSTADLPPLIGRSTKIWKRSNSNTVLDVCTEVAL